ncbi:MAG: hypothetical protein MJE77_30595 [Proteobacteria bacterium]|nr:hypothetical protein [Pseudomonadota bacterium]
MRAPIVTAAAIALLGCRGAASSNVQLAIDGSCTPEQLGEVIHLSVNVYGIGDKGDLCILGKRCIPGVELSSVQDITPLLRGQKQPLLDVELEPAAWIEVIGHSTSCLQYDDHAMCGMGDLAAVQDNQLAVSLACGNCGQIERPFCP